MKYKKIQLNVSKCMVCNARQRLVFRDVKYHQETYKCSFNGEKPNDAGCET